ncbi:Uv Excision Repair Protein Rad23 A [Manis pentadactyla]|nr:Uv Excision Repair Protein Rad23 A [Manis pentadactyla]
MCIVNQGPSSGIGSAVSPLGKNFLLYKQLKLSDLIPVVPEPLEETSFLLLTSHTRHNLGTVAQKIPAEEEQSPTP